VTGAEFSEVDIDLLADYVGGALDGTPDEAAVADLIAADPSWRDAHAVLSGGMATVGLQLHALGAVPEPMPADVFARLDAALTAAGTAGELSLVADDGATVAPAGVEPGSDGVAPARHLVAVQSRRRNRRLQWAAPVGIAAAVIAFVGFGIRQLETASENNSSSDTAASAPREEAPQSASDGSGMQILTSGLDYNKDSLGQVSARAMSAPEPPTDESGSSLESSQPGAGVRAESEDPLSRFTVQRALLACIDAISEQNGAGAVTAQTVDFARFNGAPALIVQFTASNGTWVWAAGAECGTRAAGADKLAAVKVG